MVEKAKLFFAQNSEALRFFGLAFVLLLSWVLLSTFYPSVIQQLHYFIIKPQADTSAFFLKLLGYQIEQDYMVYGCEAIIIFENRGSICVGTGCSGLELFLLFFGFILLMKGRLKDKMWFIPLGFLAILVLNIIRITILCLIYHYKPEYLQFNHKYTFVIIVYGAIFGLWVLWIKRFANTKND